MDGDKRARQDGTGSNYYYYFFLLLTVKTMKCVSMVTGEMLIVPSILLTRMNLLNELVYYIR